MTLQRIQIFGSNGCLELSGDAKVILHKKHSVGEDLLGTYHPGEEISQSNIKDTELQYTLESFKTALIENKKCETDIEENIKSFIAVLAAKESIEKNKPIQTTNLSF